VKCKRTGFTPLEMKVPNRGSKGFLTGFTIVELLTTLAIIAMLVGLLLPALSMVRNNARTAKQKAHFTSLDMALTAFRNDYGDYPPSDWGTGLYMDPTYCGAQKLAEALLGWDLLGFHPDSHWQADGRSTTGYYFYDVTNPYDMDKRAGRYLELSTANAFRLGNNPTRSDPYGLFINTSLTGLAPDRFVICDVFGVRRLTLADGSTVTAGSPILYYRANTASMTMESTVNVELRRYNAYDNSLLVALGSLTRNGQPGDPHPLDGDIENLYLFDNEGGIRDPRITARSWPHRPDSYILISAGVDGLYGTKDDICNF